MNNNKSHAKNSFTWPLIYFNQNGLKKSLKKSLKYFKLFFINQFRSDFLINLPSFRVCESNDVCLHEQ